MRFKNPIHIIAILFLLFSISSCKDSGSPGSVAEQFLTSFSQMDYATAKSLSTKNTWGFLSIMEHYTDSVPEVQKEAITSHFKIKITNTQKESDSTVIVTYTSKPKVLPFNKLRMVKHIDRYGHIRWKVDISTLDLLSSELQEDQTTENAVEAPPGVDTQRAEE